MKHIAQDSDNTEFSAAAQAASAASGYACRFLRSAALMGFKVGEFSLENGLTILLHVDQRAPIFAYQTWYRVGSRDEDPQRTGMAHLFEHLMFKATTTHDNGVFDREMQRRGCQSNAATWVDWTYYHQSLAARGDNLTTIIGFEADRMCNLVIDEQTFRSELEVVKNERRQTVDDSVPGRMSERLFDLAFTAHPYRWPTIGSMAHLEAATVETLKDFYSRYYAPNNATIVLSGDVHPIDSLTRISAAYGGLQAQTIHRPERPVEPPQHTARYVSISMQVAAPVIAVGFRAPAQGEADFVAVDMLADALVSGDSARLYRRLVSEERLCVDVDGYLPPFADPGLYEFVLNLRPGCSVKKVLSILYQELQLLSEGLTAGEISKARNSCELAQWDTLKDAESCAEALGHFQCNAKDFTLAFSALDRLQAVDGARLQRVAAEVFAPRRANVVVAYPLGQEAEELQPHA